MNLVFIYGPPAAGKLSVAKELSRITGYKIFHNQHTIDFLTQFLEFDSVPFRKLNSKLRLAVIRAAAQEKCKGMICTFCYVSRMDDEYIRKIVRVMEDEDGKVFFVQLHCTKKELEIRVCSKNRAKYAKIKTAQKLRTVLNKFDLFTPVNYDGLCIDNTRLSAKKAAVKIKEYYGL